MSEGDRVQMVFVTVPEGEEGERVARRLVEERLAACVNCLGAVRSVYRWEGEVCEDSEGLLLIKTTSATLPVLMTRLKAIHPYDEPEILAFPVGQGAASYLEWVRKSVAPDAAD